MESGEKSVEKQGLLPVLNPVRLSCNGPSPHSELYLIEEEPEAIGAIMPCRVPGCTGVVGWLRARVLTKGNKGGIVGT